MNKSPRFDGCKRPRLAWKKRERNDYTRDCIIKRGSFHKSEEGGKEEEEYVSTDLRAMFVNG
jgi:hypothetical protein